MTYIPRLLKRREQQERARGLTKDQVKLEVYQLKLQRDILRGQVFDAQIKLNDVHNEIDALESVLENTE